MSRVRPLSEREARRLAKDIERAIMLDPGPEPTDPFSRDLWRGRRAQRTTDRVAAWLCVGMTVTLILPAVAYAWVYGHKPRYFSEVYGWLWGLLP